MPQVAPPAGWPRALVPPGGQVFFRPPDAKYPQGSYVVQSPGGSYTVRLPGGQMVQENLLVDKDVWLINAEPPLGNGLIQYLPFQFSANPVQTVAANDVPGKLITPMSQVGADRAAVLLAVATRLLDNIGAAPSPCVAANSYTAAFCSKLLPAFGQVLSYLSDTRVRLNHVVTGTSAGAAWVAGSDPRIAAAIAEVTRRRDLCNSDLTFYQGYDCSTAPWTADRKAVVPNIRQLVKLYDDSVSTALAWGRAVDAAVAEWGG